MNPRPTNPNSPAIHASAATPVMMVAEANTLAFKAGYNFGESFYIAQNALRWVMTAIGDPLYAPALFAQKH